MVFLEQEKKELRHLKNILNRLKFTSTSHYGSRGHKETLNRYDFKYDFFITDKRRSTVINFDSDLVLSFVYKTTGSNFIKENERLFLSFHINKNSNNYADGDVCLKYAKVEVNGEEDIVKVFKDLENTKGGKDGEFFKVSKKIPLSEMFGISLALFKDKLFDYSSNSSSIAAKRAVVLGILEKEFNVDFILKNKKQEEVLPKTKSKAKDDSEEVKDLSFFEEANNVSELKELLAEWTKKYEPKILEEEKKVNNSAAGKRLALAKKELEIVNAEIKAMQPEFEEIKKSWKTEKEKIEKDHKDDLVKMDELLFGSAIRQKALEVARNAKALKERLTAADKLLKENEPVVLEMKSKQKVSILALEKKASLLTMIGDAEKKAKNSYDKQLTAIKKKPVNTVEDVKDSVLENFIAPAFSKRLFDNTYFNFTKNKAVYIDRINKDEKNKKREKRLSR